jgi:hypothetical protein
VALRFRSGEVSPVHLPDVGGPPSHWRSRKARSLRVSLPKSAVPMIVRTAMTSMMTTAPPSMGLSTPRLTGGPSETTAAATGRQAIRASSFELFDVLEWAR